MIILFSPLIAFEINHRENKIYRSRFEKLIIDDGNNDASRQRALVLRQSLRCDGGVVMVINSGKLVVGLKDLREKEENKNR
ncbi:hypothetical protein OWV82_014752 [Melia azedarach]|uniref:Uncharacterized protein n=1 Tax=Melia azedarach TaxID=155640 RepID=A0ACC1XMH4_MELAZ|nr:hypothetical protein OWV82_014752 [Melia azedarach]